MTNARYSRTATIHEAPSHPGATSARRCGARTTALPKSEDEIPPYGLRARFVANKIDLNEQNGGRRVKYSGFRTGVAVTAVAAALFALPAAAADWKPARPINLIVPWAAGGSTDQITRLVAGEMEKSLGQTIVIINQPGASGSIGTRSALEAAKDGYTWTAGAAQDLGAYQTLGSLDSNIKDWHLFLSVANVQVIAVNPKTPYQTPKDLLDAMKAQPGKISVATAGVTSAGHNAMELIAKNTGVKYR